MMKKSETVVLKLSATKWLGDIGASIPHPGSQRLHSVRGLLTSRLPPTFTGPLGSYVPRDSVSQGHPGASCGGQSWWTSAPQRAPTRSASPATEGLFYSPEHPRPQYLREFLSISTCFGWMWGLERASEPTDTDQISHFLVNGGPWRFLERSSDNFWSLL